MAVKIKQERKCHDGDILVLCLEFAEFVAHRHELVAAGRVYLDVGLTPGGKLPGRRVTAAD